MSETTRAIINLGLLVASGVTAWACVRDMRRTRRRHFRVGYELGVVHGREIAGEADAITATHRFIRWYVEKFGLPEGALTDEEIHAWISQDRGALS